MKVCVLLTFLALVITGLSAEETLTMPSEVTLTTGRVLRNVQVVRWEKERVVLKYSGGADPIHFSMFTEPLRSQLPAIRDGGSNAEGTTKAARTEYKFSGQIYVRFRGEPVVPLKNVRVYVFPENVWEDMSSNLQPIPLPAPLLTLYTDATGNFSFTLPAETQFVILAQAEYATSLANKNQYEWRIKGGENSNRFLLNNGNATGFHRAYKIN